MQDTGILPVLLWKSLPYLQEDALSKDKHRHHSPKLDEIRKYKAMGMDIRGVEEFPEWRKEVFFADCSAIFIFSIKHISYLFDRYIIA